MQCNSNNNTCESFTDPGPDCSLFGPDCVPYQPPHRPLGCHCESTCPGLSACLLSGTTCPLTGSAHPFIDVSIACVSYKPDCTQGVCSFAQPCLGDADCDVSEKCSSGTCNHYCFECPPNPSACPIGCIGVPKPHSCEVDCACPGSTCP